MKLLHLLTILLPSIASAGKTCCLCDSDAKAILSRWTAIFDSTPKPDPQGMVDATFVKDFTFYTEIYNGGATPINFVNSSQVVTDILTQHKPGLDSPVNPYMFKTVYSFHDCENIAFRWEFDATLTGGNEIAPGVRVPLNKTAAPAGKKIQYKGIDLLKVDCHTKLITTAWSSSDWLNYLMDIGWEFCPTAAT